MKRIVSKFRVFNRQKSKIKMKFRSFGEVCLVINCFSFSFSPTSQWQHKHQISGVTRGFARLDGKTKYVCHSLISLPKFFNNQTMRTEKLLVSIRWSVGGGVEKRAKCPIKNNKWEGVEKVKQG